ncbi:uncharacterized protein LOC128952644 isoform X2 [Oppia nitens]|uniref:uncharacterized protein LOC128952644 isoform X2 n=1 Tax=Oppia nitens TaxID=1686743 RepID=UPI0023DC5B7B|nr:uncharacterized protein LOC128952644 isoform X2 [Oppia nitens]
MSKLSLIILSLCIGQLVLGQIEEYSGQGFGGNDLDVDALLELDNYAMTSCFTSDGRLPSTVDEVQQTWCHNFLSDHLYVLDLLERAFARNYGLVTFMRLCSLKSIHDVSKLCSQPKLLHGVAIVFRLLNNFLPQLMKMSDKAKNVYLHVADPNSPLTATDLVCLIKKGVTKILHMVPAILRSAIIKQHLKLFKEELPMWKFIIHSLRIDVHFNDCQLPRGPAANPLGIRSDITAMAMAWDKVSL